MKISIDRRAKMIPIMEISSGDEVNRVFTLTYVE